MAGRPTVLKIDILADAKGVGRGVDQAEGRLNRLGGTAKKVGKAMAIGLAVGVGAAVAVGASLIGAGERAATANARITQITTQMSLFGSQTDQVNKRVIAYGETLARQTGVDVDLIKTTQAKLLTFKDVAATADVMGGSFDRATTAAVDLAAAGFGTADANAVQLGKALQDPIKGLTALNRSGVTFTDTEKARIKTLVESNQVGQAQEIILSAIEKQVGGTGRATANASDQMKVSFELVKQHLGTKLLPAFNAVGGYVAGNLLPTAERLGGSLATKLRPAFDTVGVGLAAFAVSARTGVASSDGLVGAFSKAGAFVHNTLLPAFGSFTTFLRSSVVPTLAVLGRFVLDNIVPILTTLAKFVLTRMVPAFTALAGPVLGGLRSAFGSIGKALSDNRESFAKVGAAILTLGKVLRPVASVVGTVLGGAFKVLGVILGTVIRLIATTIDIADKAVRAIGKVASVASSVGGFVGGLNPFSAPLTIGAPALVGRSGPLSGAPGRLATAALGSGGAVLSALRSAPAAGTPVVVDQRRIDARRVITVNGALDPSSVARQIKRLLDDDDTRRGARPTFGGYAG